MIATRAALLALFLSWSPLTAHAQTSPDELRRNADAIANGERGLEAFRVGDWAAAYTAFQDAETLAHSPVFLLYMARARERQGAWAEALDLYSRITREPPSEGAPESWRGAAEQAEQEAAALRARLKQRAARRAQRAAKVAATDSARSRASHNAALSAGVIGIAGLALGAAAGVVAWLELDALKSRCGPNGCRAEDRSRLEEVKTWTRLSDLGFVVGGTGLAASAFFIWVIPTTPTAGNAPVNVGASARLRF